MNDKLTRRAFLGTAAPAVIGAGLAGPRAWAATTATLGANDAIGIGVIGCGERGRYLSGILNTIPEAKIVAVCDVHKGRAAAAQKQTGGKAAVYADYRKLIEDKAVDAVVVATAGHWHVLPIIDACAAGKDVYAEKPIGTSIGEGHAAVKAARKYDRIVQVGTQQRTWEHYQQAVEIIRSGALGAISQVHVWDFDTFYPGYGSPPDGPAPAELDWEFFVGPSPRVPYNPNRFLHHYWFFDYGGGWEVDWAVHHYDIVQWAMGVSAPIAATGAGRKFVYVDSNTEWPDTFAGTCEYGPGPVAKNGFLMTYTARSACNDPIEGRPHGKAFYGSDGVLILSRSGFEIRSQTREGKKVIADKKVVSSKNEHEVVADHVRGFLECLRARKKPDADIEMGRQATAPGHLMNIAWRVGRRVKWDAAKSQVIDDPQASALLTKEYRKPWALPT